MKKQKVAIVGAGMCGLYLARELSKKGIEVTVFEKKKKIGKYACSGLFSPKILDFIPESKKIIQNRISYALLHFPKKTIKLDFSDDFLVIKHHKLDQLVFNSIDKEKVNIILDEFVESIPKGFEKVIGCDGVHSKIRKELGIKECDCRVGIQGFIEEKNSSDFVEVWPTKGGFIWKIPRGQETEYGIIEESSRAKKLFDDFLKKNNLQVKGIRSAFIPQGFKVPANNDVTLCGDAAGLTKPWSGGGVIWGLIAADILLKKFPDFLQYKKTLERFFIPKIFFYKILTRIVYFLGFNLSFLIPKKVKVENDFLIFKK